MSETSVQPRACSIASALEIVGERWALLVLREMYFGVHRFAEIQRNTGAPRDVLTKRLHRLVDYGVLEKRQYQTRPPRFEYHPTAAADALRPVLAFLDAWGTRWLPDAAHSDTVFEHDCGEQLQPRLTCACCGRAVTGLDLRPHDREL